MGRHCVTQVGSVQAFWQSLLPPHVTEQSSMHDVIAHCAALPHVSEQPPAVHTTCVSPSLEPVTVHPPPGQST